MEAEKFPAMAEVGMTSRLAGRARDQISQIPFQIRFQIRFFEAALDAVFGINFKLHQLRIDRSGPRFSCCCYGAIDGIRR